MDAVKTFFSFSSSFFLWGSVLLCIVIYFEGLAVVSFCFVLSMESFFMFVCCVCVVVCIKI